MGVNQSKNSNGGSTLNTIENEDQLFSEQIKNESVIENVNNNNQVAQHQVQYVNPETIPKIPSLPSRPFDLPVGDSPVIELPINDIPVVQQTISLSPNAVTSDQEEKEDIESPLSVEEINEDLLSAMKIDIQPTQQSNNNNNNNNTESSESSQENIETPTEVHSESESHDHQLYSAFTRDRFQTKAEAELLNLFSKTPIVDQTTTITSTTTTNASTSSPASSSMEVNQQSESIEEILAASYFNDSNNFNYKENRPKQRSTTLSKKFFNTLSRKRSMKGSLDGFSSMNRSQTTGNISQLDSNDNGASLSSLNNDSGEGSSSGNGNNNNGGVSNKQFTKYGTVSMKMSSFRKKLFNSQQDLRTSNSTDNLNEASSVNNNVSKDDGDVDSNKPKKKKFFNEFANVGNMFTREMGSVFLLTPAGPSYASYAYSVGGGF